MRRREFVLGGALAVGLCGVAAAQAPVTPYRIGMLRSSAPNVQVRRFKQRLTELGYIEGRDYVLDIGAHQGQIERLSELAAGLARLRPNVIVASGPEAVLKAVLSATKAIPIVFVAVDYDPVALGYVAGLPRPGGNVTGVFMRQAEVTAKRVELLKEMLPGLTDLAVFADAFTAEGSEQMQAAEGAAHQLGLRLSSSMLRDGPDYGFANAIETAKAGGAGAVLALMSPGFFVARVRFAEALSAHRMPASFGLREFAELGGLMSYGANIVDMYGRAADYVGKILKGTKPADLPVEQPTKFELVVNLKTALAMGLTIPQAFLLRADEVIE